jgi:hypothetical protein
MDDKVILPSPHAKEKLKRLSQIGINEEKIIQTLRNAESTLPGAISGGKSPKLLSQKISCFELFTKKPIITSRG